MYGAEANSHIHQLKASKNTEWMLNMYGWILRLAVFFSLLFASCWLPSLHESHHQCNYGNMLNFSFSLFHRIYFAFWATFSVFFSVFHFFFVIRLLNIEFILSLWSRIVYSSTILCESYPLHSIGIQTPMLWLQFDVGFRSKFHLNKTENLNAENKWIKKKYTCKGNRRQNPSGNGYGLPINKHQFGFSLSHTLWLLLLRKFKVHNLLINTNYTE